MLSFVTLASLFALLPSLIASPVSCAAINDKEILQYALTLEHLENAFYREGLERFSPDAFTQAGYPAWVRGRLAQVGQHEAQHVSLLANALGPNVVMPCQYKFPYTDVKSFVGLSSVLESVGVSAYLGAAGEIQDKAYVTVAGSILTTESRHQGWINSAALRQAAWSGPEDTPLSFNEVYSLASQFIVACPSSNPTLPFKAYPALALQMSGQISYPNQQSTGQYLVLYSGLAKTSVPITNGRAQLPTGLQGFVYGVVSSEAQADKVNDDNIIAGPAILDYAFGSNVDNSAPAF